MPTLLNEIPIVGQPLVIYSGDVNAVVKCACKESNKPFLLPSSTAMVMCEECRGVYKIVGCELRGPDQGVNIAVAQVGFAKPKPAVD